MLYKGEYYIIENVNGYTSRIKVVAVTEKFYGYIHAAQRKNEFPIIEYSEKAKLEKAALESLGKNPDYSDDEPTYASHSSMPF